MQPTWQDVINITKQYRAIKMEYWVNENVFSFSWWVLFITTIGLFILWLILLDKNRMMEIITYGFFVGTVAIFADTAGIASGLWDYRITLTPVPLNLEIHRLQMPILYMFLYQYFSSWKAFLTAALIQAFIFAFIFEPILVWLNIYEAYRWEHSYSFIPYFIIAVSFKWLIDKFKQLDENYQ